MIVPFSPDAECILVHLLPNLSLMSLSPSPSRNSCSLGLLLVLQITPALFLALPVAARRRLVCVFLDRICAPGTSREMAERDAAALHKCLMQVSIRTHVESEDFFHFLLNYAGILILRV